MKTELKIQLFFNFTKWHVRSADKIDDERNCDFILKLNSKSFVESRDKFFSVPLFYRSRISLFLPQIHPLKEYQVDH